MAIDVIMPKLGLTMEEGTVNAWLKKEGEAVQEGEPLVEVMTDKAAVEVESPGSGILRKIIVPEGGTVPIADLIGVITAPDEELPPGYGQVDAPAEEPAPAVAPAAPAAERAPEAPAAKGKGRIKASPAAKRVAREAGLSLEVLGTIVGTGPGGRITEKDVQDYVAQQKAAPAPVSAPAAAPAPTGELEPVTGIRKIMAKRMLESVTTQPQFALSVDVDMGEMINLRRRLLEIYPDVRISYTDILVAITARALEDHPEVNSRWEDGQIRRLGEVNVGVAVGAENGLVVPVVKGANRKRISQISGELKELIQKAQAGKLGPEEISGGSFTISNLGMFGIDRFQAIINPPESGILAVGQMKDQAVVRDGEITVRPMMSLTVTLDHRVLDGVQGARFLGRIKEMMENPLLIVG
ncbi:MAG: dihydrolipoamide acetyltransferase family protein [Limnochordia bacterium]|jgi:pyruvate dehydrogenase E2 component (dihydrolipoamide acetyltransferase)